MNSTRTLRIAFQDICGREWIAGCNYLRNLFLALRLLDSPVELFLLQTSETNDDTYTTLIPYLDGVIRVPMQYTLHERVIYSLQRRTGSSLGIPHPVEKMLRQSDIDVLFTSKSPGNNFRLPIMGWIPDLQHLHLPHLFPEKDLFNRDRQYKTLAQHANTIILSSESAYEDMRKFAPVFLDKLRVLNFVTYVEASAYAIDPVPIADLYHLPAKYFYLPNQFWQHKNHQVVIEALGLVQETNPEICIVCTGNTYDYRQPRYFNDLLKLVAEHGVHNQFRVLGMIPFEHIIPLMRQSIAIIQPSFFEGWSTTVEETKSLGKPIIISDIPVHREQNPPAARYFAPDDAHDLAAALVAYSEQYSGGINHEMEKMARVEIDERMRQFATRFIKLIAETVDPLSPHKHS